jgi:hypothetical protein
VVRAAAEPPAGDSSTPGFELERVVAEDGRVRVSGWWHGVRGRRFIRPSLTAVGARARTRALAELEHKPWAATEDGRPWFAEFVWEQPLHDVEALELAVAPDLAVRIPLPGASAPARSAPATPAESVDVTGSEALRTARVEQQRDRALAARDEAIAARDRLAEQHEQVAGERERLLEERDNAVAQASKLGTERDHAVSENRRLARDRDRAVRERDEALRERDEAMRERDEAMRERDEAMRERKRAETERRALAGERDALLSERDRLIEARDQARAERNGLLVQHAELGPERERLARERDRTARELERLRGEHAATLADVRRLTQDAERLARERDDALSLAEHGSTRPDDAVGRLAGTAAAQSASMPGHVNLTQRGLARAVALAGVLAVIALAITIVLSR